MSKEKWIKERTEAVSSMLDNPYSVGLYRTSVLFDKLDKAADEYAKIKSREIAIDILKWGAGNKLEFLLGVWCDSERTYDNPEEIYQTFLQQTEVK